MEAMDLTDVDAALALLTRVRADREAHRVRADKAEAQVGALLEELARAQRRAGEAEAQQVQLQHVHEHMVREWTAESAARLRDFEQLQQQVGGRLRSGACAGTIPGRWTCPVLLFQSILPCPVG